MKKPMDPIELNTNVGNVDGNIEIANISRRAFIKNMALTGFVLAAGFPSLTKADEITPPTEKGKYGADGMPNGWVDNPLIFVAIALDGTVTIVCHRSEMGQGVRTSLPMVVADELEADWKQVRVEQAPGNEHRYGNQDTDGSRSMRHFFLPMRRVGAAARTMLESAAAAQWKVPVQDVRAEQHHVLHPATGKTLGYGELAKAAAKLAVPASETWRLKNPADFRYIGKGKTALYDGKDMLTGQAQYGIDIRVTDMLYAVIARPPVFGGKVLNYDAKEALKIKGVISVIELKGSPMPANFNPLGGIAVIASNTWAAIQGRKALKIEWDKGPNGTYDSVTYKTELEAAARKSGKVVRNNGDVDAALQGAAKRVEAEYYIPHLAQAPMEPPAATARIVKGKCEIWSCTQALQVSRESVAKWLKLAEDDVTIHVTLLGGGFGRKSKPDYVVEAALLSQAMKGKPVKLTWTREDDLQHSYFHTVSIERLEAGLDAQGKAVAWLHRTVAPSISSTFGPDSKHQTPSELGMGAINVPYAIANLRIENPEAEAHTRIGWFRSVYNIPHAFAIQSFVTELAVAAGRDPKDFLLDLIGPPRRINPDTLGDAWNYGESPEIYPVDTGRLRGVIEAAAKESGWGRTLPKGHGLGIAAHYSFVTYVAVVVEASVDESGKLRIPRIDIAVDCGPQVNQERIRSQIEGACIMGVSLATLGEISFKDGAVMQDNFHNYQLTRMDDAPYEIRVHLLPPADFNTPLGGVGEPGLPPIAPALCNAIFAATGQRIRQLPIMDQLRKD